jgi:hypothetical protein
MLVDVYHNTIMFCLCSLRSYLMVSMVIPPLFWPFLFFSLVVALGKEIVIPTYVARSASGRKPGKPEERVDV